MCSHAKLGSEVTNLLVAVSCDRHYVRHAVRDMTVKPSDNRVMMAWEVLTDHCSSELLVSWCEYAVPAGWHGLI